MIFNKMLLDSIVLQLQNDFYCMHMDLRMGLEVRCIFLRPGIFYYIWKSHTALLVVLSSTFHVPPLHSSNATTQGDGWDWPGRGSVLGFGAGAGEPRTGARTHTHVGAGAPCGLRCREQALTMVANPQQLATAERSGSEIDEGRG
jgi:hypothetical protein